MYSSGVICGSLWSFTHFHARIVSPLSVVGLILPLSTQRAQRKSQIVEKLSVLSGLCGKKQCGSNQQHFAGTLPTPDSQLSSVGKARRVCYAWGTASVQDLQRTIHLTNQTGEYVAVHVNDLYETWRLGVLQFTEELKRPRQKITSLHKSRQVLL
jgi:hypothetical protein